MTNLMTQKRMMGERKLRWEEAGLQNVRNPASAACRQGPNLVGRKGQGRKVTKKKKKEKKRKEKKGKKKEKSKKEKRKKEKKER